MPFGKPSRTWTLLAAAAAIGLGAATARAEESASQPSPQQLMQQIKDLQQKVEALQARPQYNQADVDATVAKVLDDADRRSKLLQAGGMNAGYDLNRGFYIQSDDGSFLIHPGVIFQVRHATTWQKDAKNGGSSDDIQSGFEIHRLKPYIEGNAFSKNLKYRFQWRTSAADGSFLLDDAWVSYTLGDMLGHPMGGDFGFRIGQFKDVWSKEETMSDTTQLAADRSLANAVVGGGKGIMGAGGLQTGSGTSARTQGVELILTGNESPLHAEVLFHDGDRTANTDWRDEQAGTAVLTVDPTTGKVTTTTPGKATNFGVSARVDYKAMGSWDDTKAFSAKNNKATLLDVGGGFDFSQGDNVNIYRGTVDVQYNMGGKLSLFAAGYANYIDFRNLGGSGDRFDWGAVAQAGYLLTDSLEAFGRVDYFKLDSDFKVGNTRNYWELAAGVNWFLGGGGSAGHHAKVTVDVGWLPNGSPVNFNDGNIVTNGNKKDEIYLRGQFQLWL